MAIILTRGSRFFCSIDEKITPPSFEQPKEEEPPKETPGKEGPQDVPGAVPFFNMLEKRKT